MQTDKLLCVKINSVRRNLHLNAESEARDNILHASEKAVWRAKEPKHTGRNAFSEPVGYHLTTTLLVISSLK